VSEAFIAVAVLGLMLFLLASGKRSRRMSDARWEAAWERDRVRMNWLRARWHSRRAWCTNCREQPAGPDGFCSPDCHDEWQDSIAY
jgi:hypothetical protein